MESKTLWYMPLEIQKSRYTEQLCGRWMPDAFNRNQLRYKIIEGDSVPSQIKVGQVLDATGRGKYSLTQCNTFLKQIEQNKVKSGDILFLQDFWTPGIESIFYALDQYGIKMDVYSMCHAQSVDEYDFTYPMRNWMRPYEIGLDRYSKGIFVGSTIHKEQMRDAGFLAPIHVVSLPIGLSEVKERMDRISVPKEKQIIYSSRLDTEKQPHFMMAVAEYFLANHKDWKFVVTTSGNKFKSNDNSVIDRLNTLAQNNDRFIMLNNITKDEYYTQLKKSSIQLNTSLQDYVSWTLLEASAAGCDLVYPNFRSFPECVPADRLYQHQSLTDCLSLIDRVISNPRPHYNIAELSDKGRIKEVEIMKSGTDIEYNIWSNNK